MHPPANPEVLFTPRASCARVCQQESRLNRMCTHFLPITRPTSMHGFAWVRLGLYSDTQRPGKDASSVQWLKSHSNSCEPCRRTHRASHPVTTSPLSLAPGHTRRQPEEKEKCTTATRGTWLRAFRCRIDSKAGQGRERENRGAARALGSRSIAKPGYESNALFTAQPRTFIFLSNLTPWSGRVYSTRVLISGIGFITVRR